MANYDDLTGNAYPDNQAGYEEFEQFALERFRRERAHTAKIDMILHGVDSFADGGNDTFTFSSVWFRFAFTGNVINISGSEAFPEEDRVQVRDGRFLAIHMPITTSSDRSIKFKELGAIEDADYTATIIAERVGNKLIFKNGHEVTVA